MDPEGWVTITPAGLEALERHALDTIDIALHYIGPHLVEMRDGAHAALASEQSGSLRQAVASARELIMQTLKEGAKDEDIKPQSWFVQDRKRSSGVIRRHRVKFLIIKHKGDKLDPEEIDKEAELVISIVDDLSALLHSRRELQYHEVADAINLAEIALRKIFV